MHSLDDLLNKNRNWKQQKIQQDPEFFHRLETGQQPRALFIGCSDSRVSPFVITNAELGELFVCRNIGNLVYHTDLNMMSEMEYAIKHLKIKHVIVCGHYGCGAVQSALKDWPHLEPSLNSWLSGLVEIIARFRQHLEQIPDEHTRLRFLEGLNVLYQSHRVASLGFEDIKVHAWLFHIPSGTLYDLNDTLEFLANSEEFQPDEALIQRLLDFVASV